MSEFTRHRRLRGNSNLRTLVREHTLSVENLIQPLFVHAEVESQREIPSMPDVYQRSVSNCVEECKKLEEMGISGVILFGIPEYRDEKASRAYTEDGIIQKSLREIQNETEDLVLIADICLCEYMDHGHCGIVDESDGTVLNDPSLDLLQKTALSAAEAGADVVAPSAMMDGQVHAIRTILDEHNHDQCAILSYAAKYASNFYGPFRDAAESSPSFGDRKSYQMDPPNSDEALREIEADLRQGADIAMVKPALSYLDVIQTSSNTFDVPVFAYSVSGEYAMIKAASENGWLSEQKAAREALLSIQRAGANSIITYWASDVPEWES